MDSLNKRFPIYSKVIKLYPDKYRQKYGEQILQTTADMLDNSQKRSSKAFIWLKVAADLPLNITKQQLQYSGGIYMKDTPSYIKTSSIVSGLLLLPFFTALIANGLDKVINSHSLNGSWVWKMPLLGIWVLYLPLTAFVLAVGSYLFYLTKYKQTKWFKRILDIRRLWPVILPAFFAFGILFVIAFHDSGQCFVHTPAYLVGHTSQTWKCATNNQSLPVFRKLF
jgi:hypothetical protein